MKWKDSDEVMGSKDDAGSAYEEDYSPLRSRNFDLGAKVAALIAQPGMWILFVVFVLLLVIFFMFFPKGESGSQSADLNQRLQELEQKVTSLEEQNKKMDELIQEVQKSTEPMLVRLDRMESKFGKQLNDFQKQLKQLKRSPSQKSPPKTTPKTSTKKSTQNVGKTYIVQKGDTLYSISKQFSQSVPQLRKLNKLSSNEAIFPGQKLIIKP
jgi:LysM repeat protein